MFIDLQVLKNAGGVSRKHEKGQRIFSESSDATYYYQIVTGEVSIVSINDEGIEFIQGKFLDGQCFGLAAVLLGEPFPASAIATSDTVVIQLHRESFLNILKHSSNLVLDVCMLLSKKLYKNALIGKGIAIDGPEKRILTLLKVLKKENENPDAKFKLPFSRQEVAGMIGLRVETVIRAIKKLEQRGYLEIIRGKVYY